jgi:hypothetical protein
VQDSGKKHALRIPVIEDSMDSKRIKLVLTAPLKNKDSWKTSFLIPILTMLEKDGLKVVDLVLQRWEDSVNLDVILESSKNRLDEQIKSIDEQLYFFIVNFYSIRYSWMRTGSNDNIFCT